MQKLDAVNKDADLGYITHDANAGTVSLPRHTKPAHKEWDDQIELKRQYMEKYANVEKPLGTPTLSDRDIRAMLAKKKADVAAEFDGWFGQNWNKADLPTRQLGAQLNADYYRQREDTLVKRAKMALQIELIKLYGPRSEEDLMLMFGIKRGYITLDKNYDKISWDAADAADQQNGARNQARRKRGLYSVSNFFKTAAERSGRNVLFGQANDRALGPYDVAAGAIDGTNPALFDQIMDGR